MPAAAVGIEVMGDRQMETQPITASPQQCTRHSSRRIAPL
jgi:hypothetical protein